jgi:hypothetical protein
LLGCAACSARTTPPLEPFDAALAEQRRYLVLGLKGEPARRGQLRRERVAELEALDGPGWERTGRHGQQGTMSVELKRSVPGCAEAGTTAPKGISRHAGP